MLHHREKTHTRDDWRMSTNFVAISCIFFWKNDECIYSMKKLSMIRKFEYSNSIRSRLVQKNELQLGEINFKTRILQQKKIIKYKIEHIEMDHILRPQPDRISRRSERSTTRKQKQEFD